MVELRKAVFLLLLSLLLPALVHGQEQKWRVWAVPYLGHSLVDSHDGLELGAALYIGTVIGMMVDLETPVPWFGIRAGASRTIGARATRGGRNRSEASVESLGIDVRLSPVPRKWLVRPFVAAGISTLHMGYEPGEEGVFEGHDHSWQKATTVGIGVDAGARDWSLRVETVHRRYEPAEMPTQGHLLATVGLLIPLR